MDFSTKIVILEKELDLLQQQLIELNASYESNIEPYVTDPIFNPNKVVKKLPDGLTMADILDSWKKHLYAMNELEKRVEVTKQSLAEEKLGSAQQTFETQHKSTLDDLEDRLATYFSSNLEGELLQIKEILSQLELTDQLAAFTRFTLLFGSTASDRAKLNSLKLDTLGPKLIVQIKELATALLESADPSQDLQIFITSSEHFDKAKNILDLMTSLGVESTNLLLYSDELKANLNNELLTDKSTLQQIFYKIVKFFANLLGFKTDNQKKALVVAGEMTKISSLIGLTQTKNLLSQSSPLSTRYVK